MKWLKRFFTKNKQNEKIESNINTPTQVLTMQIDKSGKIATNLPAELEQTINPHTITQFCKVMGYIAILEMQTTSRTLH